MDVLANSNRTRLQRHAVVAMNAGENVDIRLRSPATLLISGPTGSGKTELLRDLIAHAETVATEAPAEIVYCYDIWQKAYERMEGVRFHRGLVDVEEEFDGGDGLNRWLIIDDLMQEVVKSGKIDSLFTKLSHHLNLTVFLVVQNLFLKDLRTASLNAHYMFLGKNPRDALTPLNLAKQVYPGRTQFFLEVYEDAVAQPYSFLLINFRAEADERVRLISNYARPGKSMYAYAPRQ